MNPGRYLKYWQGIVAVVLRLASLVFPVAIFLCTAVALGEINSLDSEEKDIINGDYDVDGFPYDLEGSNDAPDTPDLVKVSLALASVLLVVSVIVGGYHLLLLLQHLLGVYIDGFVIFLISDLFITTGVMLIYICFGSATAWAASEWDDWVDFVEDTPGIIGEELRALDSLEELENIRDILAAAAAFSFLAVPVLIINAAWTVFFFIKEWHKMIATG